MFNHFTGHKHAEDLGLTTYRPSLSELYAPKSYEVKGIENITAAMKNCVRTSGFDYYFQGFGVGFKQIVDNFGELGADGMTRRC